MFQKNEIEKIFNDFEGLKVLIIGDIMIDSYLWGNVDRISPEAPVPIVAVKKRENRLGGAANVALNVKSLGAVPILCTVIGNDLKGAEFVDLLEKENLSTQGIYRSTKRITTTKFRIIGNNTQMLRVDEEIESNLFKEELQYFISIISEIIDKEKIDVIIFEDYDKGLINTDLIEKVVSISEKNNIPIAVDPKKRNFDAYRNLSLFKPNLKELKEGLKIDFNHKNLDELITAVKILQEKHNVENVLVTLSEDGIFVRSKNDDGTFKNDYIPAHIRSIADVSGAGDTVISVTALCMAMGLLPKQYATLANLAGGLVCEEVGVVPIDKGKFRKEVEKLNKIN